MLLKNFIYKSELIGINRTTNSFCVFGLKSKSLKTHIYIYKEIQNGWAK